MHTELPNGWAKLKTAAKRMFLLFLILPITLIASESECLLNKRFNLDSRLIIDCGKTFHFYNSNAYKNYYSPTASLTDKELQIGSFNLLNFGSNAAPFKDIDLIAKIMNQMDIVAVTEIMPIMGRDLWHNNGIVKYLEKYPANQAALNEYIFPGYFVLLKKLMALDQSWSLILSAKSLSSNKATTSEYVGFFFRSSQVRPIEDEHCREYASNNNESFACFPSLGTSFMGDDYLEFFSRRPFVGHFQSGNFDFTLLASHVIYGPPSDSKKRKKFLQKFFQVDSTRDVPFAGVNSTNYARLIEAQLIMKMMNRYKSKYIEQDVIYAGDMNINADNQFMLSLLWDFSLDILIDHPTTISQGRFLSGGVRTNGYSEDYDHFLYDFNETGHECDDNGKIIDFFNGFIRQEIQDKYLIRSSKLLTKNDSNDYEISGNGRQKMLDMVGAYRKKLETQITVKRGKLTLDNYKVDERVQEFQERIFESQLNNNTYYKIYREVISDHMPISLSCSTVQRDDD